MAQKVRIARLDAATTPSPFLSGRPLWEDYAAINSFIRRYLPAASATLLAEPLRQPESSFIDWYTSAGGKPVLLSSLNRSDRDKAVALLTDRLLALRDLAARQSADPAAALLAAAAIDPPTESIYVVNGQPVIIGWGHPGTGVPLRPAAIPAPPPPVASAVAAAETAIVPPVVARRAFPWIWLGGLLALALLLALLWWLWPLWWGAKDDDQLAILAAEEAALKAEIATAEDELRRRLAACVPVADATPPPVQPEKEIPVAPEPLPPGAEATPEITQPPPQPTPVPDTKPVKPAPPAKTETNPPPSKPQAKAAAEDPPPPSKCPPPRKKWEVPELVVLLDASGSMRLKADGGQDRLTVAKKAVGRVVASLPGDMDVGLMVFGNCKGVDSHKFFAPAERPRLNALLETIRPMEGTPLARGIERAGNVVDGVTVPATLVVVTDGEDSCGGDPCAAARKLKAAKPLLTINVVDVNGRGEGRCIAEATGGRVLPMKSAVELPELIRKASGETPVPPGCGGS